MFSPTQWTSLHRHHKYLALFPNEKRCTTLLCAREFPLARYNRVSILQRRILKRESVRTSRNEQKPWYSISGEHQGIYHVASAEGKMRQIDPPHAACCLFNIASEPKAGFCHLCMPAMQVTVCRQKERVRGGLQSIT